MEEKTPAVETEAPLQAPAVLTKAQEKKERRQVKHEVWKRARRHAVRRYGLYATLAQLKAGAKILTDRYISQQVNS